MYVSRLRILYPLLVSFLILFASTRCSDFSAGGLRDNINTQDRRPLPVADSKLLSSSVDLITTTHSTDPKVNDISYLNFRLKFQDDFEKAGIIAWRMFPYELIFFPESETVKARKVLVGKWLSSGSEAFSIDEGSLSVDPNKTYLKTDLVFRNRGSVFEV